MLIMSSRYRNSFVKRVPELDSVPVQLCNPIRDAICRLLSDAFHQVRIDICGNRKSLHRLRVRFFLRTGSRRGIGGGSSLSCAEPQALLR